MFANLVETFVTVYKVNKGWAAIVYPTVLQPYGRLFPAHSMIFTRDFEQTVLTGATSGHPKMLSMNSAHLNVR